MQGTLAASSPWELAGARASGNNEAAGRGTGHRRSVRRERGKAPRTRGLRLSLGGIPTGRGWCLPPSWGVAGRWGRLLRRPHRPPKLRRRFTPLAIPTTVLGAAHLSPEVRDIVYVSTVAPQQGGIGPEAPAPFCFPTAAAAAAAPINFTQFLFFTVHMVDVNKPRGFGD